jgi:hypothetical protein
VVEKLRERGGNLQKAHFNFVQSGVMGNGVLKIGEEKITPVG